LFPLGVKIYAHDVHRIGAKAGKILFFNTAGCVLGSLLTGFVLIPFAGMWNTTLILVNLGLLISFLLLLRTRDSSRVAWAALLLACILGNLLVFSDSKTFHKEMKGLNVLCYAEGLSGTVSVLGNDSYRGIFVDGQNVSGTDPVLVADSKMLAHLPLLLADDPRSSVTVGFGTGTTSGSMLLHIGVADQHFDVIVTDVTNLKYKRNPYLYTREYFEIMRAALTEDGIAAAWLPLGGLSFEDLRILIATFNQVYPHTTVWYFTQYPTHFVIAVGTPERTSVDLTRLAERMKKVRADLRTIKVDDACEIAGMLLLGEQDVDEMVAGAPIHTDNHPVLEFSDMDLYMQIDVAPNLKRLLGYQKEDLGRYFTGTDRQLAILKRHFEEYQRNYRSYIAWYEREAAPKGD